MFGIFSFLSGEELGIFLNERCDFVLKTWMMCIYGDFLYISLMVKRLVGVFTLN